VLPCPVAGPSPVAADARAAVRRDLGAAPETVVVLQASRIEPGKGHAVLIEALGALRERDDWVAWVAGGPQRPAERDHDERLRAEARRHGVSDRVHFLGQRRDVPRLLAAADVFCQPNTEAESFGIAFIEALDAGLPVVGTRLGGPSEIVTSDCGVLIDPGDPSALAAALSSLIDDPAARARLGAAGPARARSLCDPSVVMPRFEALVRGLATSSPRRAEPIGAMGP
jgi:glycosyltransferase involved in cell wall biosynthesis